MDHQPKVSVVNHVDEARDQVKLWMLQGHSQNNIFVLAHDKNTTDWAAEYTDAEKIGMAEEGVLGTIANVFRSQGDELRAKLKAMNVAEPEVERLEKELDEGKIVVLAADR